MSPTGTRRDKWCGARRDALLPTKPPSQRRPQTRLRGALRSPCPGRNTPPQLCTPLLTSSVGDHVTTPRRVACELSRVGCCLRRRQQQISTTPPPPCDIPSGCCSFTGPWTVTPSSLRMLRRVAAFCRPLRPVLLLVSFPHSRSPVVWCAGAVLPPLPLQSPPPPQCVTVSREGGGHQAPHRIPVYPKETSFGAQYFPCFLGQATVSRARAGGGEGCFIPQPPRSGVAAK